MLAHLLPFTPAALRWLARSACGAGLLWLAGCSAPPPCAAPADAAPRSASGGCLYENMANADARPNAGTFRIWSRFFFATKEGTVPVDAIPVQPLTPAQLDALPADANHIVRLGHSSHLLKLQGRYWLIDPVFGERVSPFSFIGPKRFHAPPIALQDLPAIDGLLLSHDHYDHLDLPTIEYLQDKVQLYVVPLGVGARLRDMGVAPERITEFDWWQSGEYAGVKLTAAPAQHFSGRTLWDRNSTLWASWVLEVGGQKIFYSGDSGYFSGFKRIGERFGGFDLALIENGAYNDYWPAVHMTPEQSVQAVKDVNAKVLYSVHNSTFDLAFHTWQDPLERIAKLSEEQHLTLATPEIGEVMTIGQPRTNRLWWQGLR